MDVLPNKPVVLVVDDEPLLRMDAAVTLEAAGFQVVEAADALEALAVIEARPDVLAVITDIQMPGPIDGLVLTKHVRQVRPELAIVVVSGKIIPSPEELPAGVEFMSKPYSPVRLVRVVRQLLAA